MFVQIYYLSWKFLYLLKWPNVGTTGLDCRANMTCFGNVRVRGGSGQMSVPTDDIKVTCKYECGRSQQLNRIRAKYWN